MNAKWTKLAADLLDLAADEFSNHGCNDWKWPPNWSEHERNDLALAIVQDNASKPTHLLNANEIEEVNHMASGKYGPPDWWLMRFMAKKLREQT